MHFTRKLMGVLICFGIATTIPAAASDDSEVISVVNGVKITRGDLEKKQGNRLLQAKYDYYAAQRKALDQLIDEQLVEAEAAKQNITVEQLLNQAVKPAPEPSDEALQVYYMGLKTDEPFENYKQKIRDHIKATQTNKARLEYIRSLREKASIRVDLMPPSADVNLDDAYVNGSKTAPVVLIEFADYECPYCAKVYPQIQKLKEEFGDKVAIAFRDFPLSIHKNAEKAAEASRCAGQQG
ncbi:MAG: thioredoxin domain-containing protein, partial [Acidobacteria bacterium]|nr:thioredoxin domain-containing protein [Acidobacteriota bacterium]